MTTVFDNIHKAGRGLRLPPMPQEVAFGGIRLIAIPPGVLNLRQKITVNMFDVNLGTIEHRLALNSDKLENMVAPAETLAFVPNGTDYILKIANPLPGCALEVDDLTLDTWMEQGEVSGDARRRTLLDAHDGVAADLGRSAIRHLMHAAGSNTAPDRLTVEALALGIAARGMAQLGALDRDIDAEISTWNHTSRRSEINRAIDLIETRLCDADLSISDLADAACLSSSRFSSVFRSMIGETPYAFILRRRAEYARDLIIGTREPLSQIAYDAGFSSQAHMTVVVRKVFGVTPAAMRT